MCSCVNESRHVPELGGRQTHSSLGTSQLWKRKEDCKRARCGGGRASLLWAPIPTPLCGCPCCSVAQQNRSDPGPAEGAKDAQQAKHTHPSSTSHHIPLQDTEPRPLCHMTREGPKSCILQFREQSMNVLIFTGILLGWS